MKKNYLRNPKPGSAGRLWALLALLWFVPLLGQAQTFKEDMSEVGVAVNSRESIAVYAGRGGFTYDQVGPEQGTFTYGGNARTAATGVSTVYDGASGGGHIFFGASNSGEDPGGGPYSFSISGINTTQLTNIGLKFGLRTQDGVNPGSALFKVEYTIDGSTYIDLPYSRTSNETATGARWNSYAVSLPSGNTTQSATFGLRFTRTVLAATLNDLYRLDDVTLTGTQPTPATISANQSFLFFGTTTVVGSTSAPQAFTASAQGLTSPLLINASTNYLVSTTSGGPYQASLSLGQSNGIVPATTIYVVFRPTTSGPINESITLSSTGATTQVVNTAATAQPAPATLTATGQLNFPNTEVGQVSSVQSFIVEGSNLGTEPVTVSAPTGFQVRLPNGVFAASVTFSPSSGSVSQVVEARFAPTSTGAYEDNITLSSGSVTTSIEVNGIATAVPTGPYIVVNPATLDFGSVAANGSAQSLSFFVNAGNLEAPLVLTGSNNNIVFRIASLGGDPINGPIVINPTAKTVSLTEVEVSLVGPVGSGEFTGTITASSEGATDKTVSIEANRSIEGNSTINITGELAEFSTVPGVASDVQSYIITGTNLLQGLKIAAPQYFQISLTPDFAGIAGTGNSFTIPKGPGGDIAATTIYVRFLPPLAISVTENILNTSNPAIGATVQANGTSKPIIQIENPFVPVVNVVLNTKSPSRELTINAKRVLKPITISSLLTANTFNSDPPKAQFELSLDNLTFSNTITLMPNTSSYDLVNQKIYVRYTPTYLGTGQATLQYQSDDFEITSTQSFIVNALLSSRSIDVEPTLRSTAVVSPRVDDKVTVTFNLPANYAALGYGEGRLIIASQTAVLPPTIRPQDGTPYTTGNQKYGEGPTLAPGFFIVYAGPNSSTTIEGFDPAVTYYFYTFEFNNIQNDKNTIVPNAENYLSPPVPSEIPGIVSPGDPTLPVTLVSFSAKLSGSQVALRWETASELNNKQFEIERSLEGRTFETIITRSGQGNTNTPTVYNEVDRKPLNGLSYYRLKQVDLDGTSSYSAIVFVNFLKDGEVAMYPNPVTDQLTITMGGNTEGVSVIITDLTGRTVRTQKLQADGKLDMANLQAGTYLITVGNGKAKVTRRIVKQ